MKTILGSLALLVFSSSSAMAQQAVLSGFEGSTELGVYRAGFERLAYGKDLGNQGQVEWVEGSMLSRVFEKPEGKSNFEVFRSYETELQASGFEVYMASALNAPTSFKLKQIYAPPHTPSFSERVYTKPDGSGELADSQLAYVVGLADHYILASKSTAGKELWVAVILSGARPFYMIEELTISAREEGTVRLNLEALRAAIADAGKIAIYDIHFATGSAEIEASSAEALAVIATYLAETQGGFYIVGHTDDTGTLASNLSLSEARAAAVKQALVQNYGVDETRLEARGVGPLAPVSNNTDDGGRALNRRVEIVQRLP